MHAAFPLSIAATVAAVGLYGALTRRHVIMLLLSLELILAGANLALVTMGVAAGHPSTGYIFALFVLTIAAAEMGVGLAIILLLFAHRGNADLTTWTSLRGGDIQGRTPVDAAGGERR